MTIHLVAKFTRKHGYGLLLLCFLSVSCFPVHTNQVKQPDIFPFGVFDKSDPYGQFDKKPYEVGSNEWKQYRSDFVALLKEYNMNTLATTAYRETEHVRYVLDHLYQNDIRVILNPGNLFKPKELAASKKSKETPVYRHPAIIAFKLGNEPKDEEKLDRIDRKFNIIREYSDKPIVTAMIGEIMGPPDHENRLKLKGSTEDSAEIAWDRLDPEILFARHYPLRREYDLVYWYREKMKMPFHEWCAHMEEVSGDKPWWYIPQLVGKGKTKDRASYWRFPTSAELNAMVHTALAHGARGIIGWGMPSYDVARKPTRTLLVDENLEPEVARDGSVPLEQYGRIGALVKSHGDLLSRHQPADIDLVMQSESVLAVPRIDPADKSLYVYIVNMDAEHRRQLSATLPASIQASSAKDIFMNRPVQLSRTSEGSRLAHELEPGEAMLVRID